MKYVEYREHREQGTFDFPIAFYHQTPRSPRYDMPYHWHTHCELLHINSGTFSLTLDNENFLCHEGDIVFITDGVLHGGTPHDCVYDSIVFDLQILLKDNHACTKTLHDIMKHRIKIHPMLSRECEEINPVVEGLCMALAQKHPGYEFMTQGYLYQLLGRVVENRLYNESTVIESAGHISAIKDVLNYISENYSGNISLDELAHIAGMNPKYFCRYFRGMTERTPIDYLNYYRIECACEMLSTRDISIKETAIFCGFNDESYFIKTFHKYKGITPKKFMNSEFK